MAKKKTGKQSNAAKQSGKRGPGSEGAGFDATAFAEELSKRLGLELVSWAVRLRGLVKIRAFGLLVAPEYGAIEPSLLTDKENFEAGKDGKWNFGDWRFYTFTGSPNSKWPYGENLRKQIERHVRRKPHAWIHPKFDYWTQPREDFEILLACAKALEMPKFLSRLEGFDLTDDFELGVFHAHDEQSECNFMDKKNRSLSVLKKAKE